MKAGNRPRPPPGASGGSRVLTYVLISLVAILFTYYVIVPMFTPKPTTSPSGSTGTNSAAISLSTSTDIAGSSVTITGQNLPANHTVTAKFGTASLNLTGTCKANSAGALSGCDFWVPNLASGSYNLTLTAGTTTIATKFTIPQYSPPVSTLLVTLTSVGLGFITQLVTRAIVDLNKERKMRAEVTAFNKQKREATVAGDKARLDKLKKRELQVRQEQAKVQTARFKVTAITFVPLLAVYYLMASFLGGYGVIVAFTPLPIPFITAGTQNPAIFEVSLFWWYFLSSFTFSTMQSKLLHTTP